MLSNKLKDSLIITSLMLLISFMLFNSFKRPHRLFFDEKIFYSLALETSKSPTQYNTRNLLEESRKSRPTYPWDLFWAKSLGAPIFKHPPMFTDIIRPFFKIWGTSMQTGFYVTLLLYVLLIPSVYLLSITLFNRNTALIAASLMSIEPVMMITAQKIVSDIPVALFSTLSIFLYARIIKDYSPLITICAGICAGFAFLTKYPGILITVAIFIYALSFQRQILTKRSFWFSLCIPFLMAIPWFLFNYHTYGIDFLTQNHQIIELQQKTIRFISTFKWPLLIAALLTITFKKKLNNHDYLKNSALIVGFITLISLLTPHILNTFDLWFKPTGGCLRMGMFRHEPWHFYLNRLIELSPFYIFGILSLAFLFFDTKYKKAYLFLLTFTIVILVFFIFWKDYQSRYITQAITPLLILSARVISFMTDEISLMQHKKYQQWATIGFFIILVTCAYRTGYVDYYFSKLTSLCYY